MSIDRNRMHEMLAELGTLVTTTTRTRCHRPAFELDRAFRDRIVALPEVEAVSTAAALPRGGRGAAYRHRRL